MIAAAGRPLDRPRDWVETVNTPLTAKELERVGASERRGRPFGSDAWVERTVAKLGLTHTLRREGRQRKA